MNRRYFFFPVAFAALVQASAQGQVMGADDAAEDVQIRSIDFTNQVLELHNFGTMSLSLDGWRFCSHDELDGFDYTSSTGLNGQSLVSGGSLFVHWNNDAAGANAINVSSLGGAWVDDLSATTVGSAVSIGLYRSSSFGTAANLIDHIQYSFEGADVGGATPRSGVATSAGLWGSASDWIDVDASSTSVSLTADPFPGAASSHSSSSYTVVPEPTSSVLLLGTLGLVARRRR